jgi:hypothetical protein
LSIDGGYDQAILDNVMQLLKQLSEKRQLAVALDEFQEIALYRQDGFEKRLHRTSKCIKISAIFFVVAISIF